MSKETGRPKEEGGHKPLKISVDKFIREGLQKVGNKSQFLEKVARPILEKMDPGTASHFLWRIDIYISQGIIEATGKGDFKQVNALSWLANQLELARKLCKIPPSNFKLLSTEVTLPWEKQAFEDFIKIRNAGVNKDPDDLVQVPEATLRCIETYPKLTGKMSSEITELENQMKWAYDFPDYILRNPYLGIVKPRQRLIEIANVTVPKILKKAFAILQEK